METSGLSLTGVDSLSAEVLSPEKERISARFRLAVLAVDITAAIPPVVVEEAGILTPKVDVDCAAAVVEWNELVVVQVAVAAMLVVGVAAMLVVAAEL